MFFVSWFMKKWRWQQFSNFNPRPSCLKPIEDKPCIKDVYVCRHKSKDARVCLLSHDYNARVVSGPVKGQEDYHIWIELIDADDGEVYWYDPTWYNRDPFKYGCHKAAFWKDRKKVEHKIHGVIEPTGDTTPPNKG